MRTAAVWGAGGFVGRHLVPVLRQTGWQVRALVRKAGTADSDAQALPLSATPEEMRAALRGMDAAFHCAGTPAEDAAGLADYERGSTQFAQAAAASGVAVLIQLSTVAVYGARPGENITTASPLAPATPYARSRAAAEAAAQSSIAGGRTRCVVVRVPMVVGPGMTSDALRLFFGTLRHGFFFHPGARHTVLNCIGVSRLCRLLAALADRPPPEAAAVVQFADNVRWTDIAAIYGKQAGRAMRRVRIPRALASAGSRILLGRKAEQGLAAFANTVTYGDDADRLGIDLRGTSQTATEIAEVARRFDAEMRGA